MSAWDDVTAQGYADAFGDDPSIFVVVRAVDIPADAKVLDIGCGTGSALRSLVNGTRGLVGVDPTPRFVEIAQDAGGDIAYYVAGAEDLPCADGAMDVVLALNVVHHWDDPAKGFAEVARVTAPGGTFVNGGEVFGADMLPGGQVYEEHLTHAGFVQVERWERDGVSCQTARRADV